MPNLIEKDAVFLNRLVSLLNSDVRIKTKEAIDAEESCEALKWELTRCIEETLKIGAFPEDFVIASFLSTHVNAPVDLMKEQIEKPWLKDKFTIGLMGHFNVGKTTALNLILDEHLPTKDDENTALAAYLIHGLSSQMSIVTKSGQSLVLSEDDSKALDYAYGKKKFPFARIFNYIVKENPSKLLDSLTLIDTPGLGKNLGHSEPTLDALNSCDGVIWFINITNSFEDSDVKFIAKNIGDKTLYVVLSFVDDARFPDKAIQVIKDRFDKQNVKVEAFFQLGYGAEIKDQFSKEIRKVLATAAQKHESYNPYAHIYGVIQFVEKCLVDFKAYVTGKFNELDRETDRLLDDYQRSRQTFVTEFNTCCQIMSNVVSTFNNRCAGAAFCGGASGAICNLLNSYQQSFNRMSSADDAVDPQKLVDFGNGTSRMSLLDYRSKQAAEVIERIQKLKKIFE